MSSVALHGCLRCTCIILALTAALACGPIPGGSLGGIQARVPDDWTTVIDGDRTLCEIEARPSNPHSIQLECFLYQDRLHVQSHRWALATWWPVESWAAIWIQHPNVRVRIGPQLFDVKAQHIATPVERRPILAFRGYEPVPDGIAVFRFVRRDP